MESKAEGTTGRETEADGWENRFNRALDEVEKQAKDAGGQENDSTESEEEKEISDWDEKCQHALDKVESEVQKNESQGPDKNEIDEAREQLHSEFVDDMEKKLDNEAKANEYTESSSHDKPTRHDTHEEHTIDTESSDGTVSKLVIERPSEETQEQDDSVSEDETKGPPTNESEEGISENEENQQDKSNSEQNKTEESESGELTNTQDVQRADHAHSEDNVEKGKVEEANTDVDTREKHRPQKRETYDEVKESETPREERTQSESIHEMNNETKSVASHPESRENESQMSEIEKIDYAEDGAETASTRTEKYKEDSESEAEEGGVASSKEMKQDSAEDSSSDASESETMREGHAESPQEIERDQEVEYMHEEYTEEPKKEENQFCNLDEVNSESTVSEFVRTHEQNETEDNESAETDTQSEHPTEAIGDTLDETENPQYKNKEGKTIEEPSSTESEETVERVKPEYETESKELDDETIKSDKIVTSEPSSDEIASEFTKEMESDQPVSEISDTENEEIQIDEISENKEYSDEVEEEESYWPSMFPKNSEVWPGMFPETSEERERRLLEELFGDLPEEVKEYYKELALHGLLTEGDLDELLERYPKLKEEPNFDESLKEAKDYILLKHKFKEQGFSENDELDVDEIAKLFNVNPDSIKDLLDDEHLPILIWKIRTLEIERIWREDIEKLAEMDLPKTKKEANNFLKQFPKIRLHPFFIDMYRELFTWLEIMSQNEEGHIPYIIQNGTKLFEKKKVHELAKKYRVNEEIIFNWLRHEKYPSLAYIYSKTKKSEKENSSIIEQENRKAAYPSPQSLEYSFQMLDGVTQGYLDRIVSYAEKASSQSKIQPWFPARNMRYMAVHFLVGIAASIYNVVSGSKSQPIKEIFHHIRKSFNQNGHEEIVKTLEEWQFNELRNAIQIARLDAKAGRIIIENKGAISPFQNGASIGDIYDIAVEILQNEQDLNSPWIFLKLKKVVDKTESKQLHLHIQEMKEKWIADILPLLSKASTVSEGKECNWYILVAPGAYPIIWIADSDGITNVISHEKGIWKESGNYRPYSDSNILGVHFFWRLS